MSETALPYLLHYTAALLEDSDKLDRVVGDPGGGVWKIAMTNAVEPLLFWSLQKKSDSISREQQRHFSRTLHATAAKNLFFIQEIERLTRFLETQGISSLVFKGPVLAADAYGNLGLRPATDIDVLIAPGDLERTEAILIADGYRPFNKISQLGAVQKWLHLRLSRQYPFTKSRELNIDLHTGVVSGGFVYPPGFDTLLRNSRVLEISGKSIRTLSVEDTLQMLCFQGVKNRWEQLKFVCDVAFFVNAHPEIDWEAVTRDARAYRWEKILYLGLFLASDLLGVTFPEDVNQKIKKELVVRGLGKLVRTRLEEQNPMTWGERTWYYLAVQDTLARKVRYTSYSILRQVLHHIPHGLPKDS